MFKYAMNKVTELLTIRIYCPNTCNYDLSTSMFVRQAVKIDTSMTVCAYIRVTVFKRKKNQRRKKVIDPAAFCSIRERPVQLPWRYQGARPRWHSSTLSFGCYWAAGRKGVRACSPLLKDAKEGASAMDAGRVFQLGIVRGKKLYLKVSVDVEYWRYWSLWDDLGINLGHW